MDVENNAAQKSDSFVIRAINVPLEFFENRDMAKKYFRRFGKVKLVMFKPKRRALVIEYANEDSMLNALEVAGEYNGHVFNVMRDTETVVKKKKVKKDPDPDWTEDADVKAELEAMGAFGPKRNYELRSEDMIVDPLEVSQILKNKQRKWKSVSTSPKPVKKKTFSIEDKFKILDARDKLIRIKLKKNIELSKASPTVGTCPDMCPEKERLMRETQHQVALYEQDGGKGMNPRLAVKQYSRSSADQEAPLPQELRPVSVLQMTMGYLMHKIVDLCDTPDVSIAEWYHFLWDRMRGIRKDITQQELCCQGSVELVEQCARFHIFCSARLVSEDPSVFDQKINTENLTKCLQTLKYMYHDLQLKAESCKNEPEFRAYIILLNLNDGNFMWEVQQLKKDIQQSKEVKFALEIYSSLDKHNYVKFFKLVNSTTYLNACILMRYFIQVRVSAIKTLLKSYSPRISQTSLPVSYLTKILAFESNESTIEFFESYGLYTDVERNRIILNRPSFSDPEYAYVLDRAINLVESKRKFSLGEVICGKELPPRIFENHVPQNSFTDEGYLQFTQDIDEIDSVMKKEEPVKTMEQKEEPPKMFGGPNIFPPKPTDSSKVGQNLFAPKQGEHVNRNSPNIFATSSNIFAAKQSEQPSRSSPNIFAQKLTGPSIFAPKPNENIFAVKQSEHALNQSTPNVFAPRRTEHSIFGQGSSERKDDNNQVSVAKSLWAPKTNIFGGEITPLIPPKSAENTENQTAREETPSQTVIEQKRIEEESKQLKQEQERIKKKLEEERKKAELEKQRLQEELRRLEETRKAAAAKKKLMEDLKRIEEEKQKTIEIKVAVNDTIDCLLNQVEENIKEEKLAEISRRIHDRKLKQVIAKWKENTRRKRKRKAIDFNPLWFGTKTLQEEADELRICSQELTLFSIKRYKKGLPFEIPLKEDKVINKIDLCELTYNLIVKKYLELDMKLHQELFWKITVSLPNELEFGCGLNHVEKVLENHIQWKERNSTTVLVQQSKSSPTVTYCVEKQKGLVINTNRNDTNGFIFVANDFNDDLRKRIIHNFKNYGVFVKIPIVLALQSYDENRSNLKSLIEERIISDYLIIVDKFTSKNLINIIEEALIFLSTKVEKCPPLEMDTLKSFLMKYLCSDIWKRINSFAKWNSNYKNCLKNPNTVIYLYNEALGHLKTIVLNEACKEYSKFPDIFKGFLRSEIPDALPCDYKYFPSFWDNPSYIKYIEGVLNGLNLPNFLENWPPSNQLQLELSISKYCAQIFKEPQASFYRIMSVLLKNIDPDVNFKDISNVKWTDVVELLATEKLNQTNFSLYGTGFVNKSVYNQLITVYDINTLHDYVKCDWFYINNPVIRHKILQLLKDEKEKVIVDEDKFEDFDIDEVLAKLNRPSRQNVGKIKNELTDCKKLLNELEDTFVVHKKILETSGNLLRSIIEDS
ncbi:xmas-2 [Asbolus verrucosus]|uniref:Germinal-center associated nuclear protein n=1 Tax=Asbolus verrucosus TaxID=1661398 RepID=A0A482VXF2_ASBVE|nr:xmas-2 [Asbolus verrucosus]